MNPFNFFDHIYCINLDSRIDRWKEISQDFEDLEILNRVERFPGIEYNPGWRGCDLSHVAILENAKKCQYKNILIFEDDANFEKNILDILEFTIIELQTLPHWDLLYLGATLQRPCTKITNYLMQTHGNYATHAYAINGHFYDIMLNRPDTERQDVWMLNELHPKYTCLCVNPLVCFQRPSWSNVEQRYDNHKPWMLDLYEQYKPKD